MKLTMELVSDNGSTRKYASVERSVWDADKPAGLLYVNVSLQQMNRLTDNPYQPIVHKQEGYKWACKPCWVWEPAFNELNSAWRKQVELHEAQ